MNKILEAIDRCNVSGELFNLTPTRPKGMSDAEYIVWLYECVCMNVGRGVGGAKHCGDYSSLRWELTNFIVEGQCPK